MRLAFTSRCTNEPRPSNKTVAIMKIFDHVSKTCDPLEESIKRVIAPPRAKNPSTRMIMYDERNPRG